MCVSSYNTTPLHPPPLLLFFPVAATFRAGEGGSVCRSEETLPSQGHRPVLV